MLKHSFKLAGLHSLFITSFVFLSEGSLGIHSPWVPRDLHQKFTVQSCYEPTVAAIEKQNRNVFTVTPCLKVGIQKTEVKQLSNKSTTAQVFEEVALSTFVLQDNDTWNGHMCKDNSHEIAYCFCSTAY